MIWLVFSVLILLLVMFVAAPLLSEAAPENAADDGALDEARAQLKQLESDQTEGRISPEMAEQTRAALEQRVLELLDGPSRADGSGGGHVRRARLAVPIVLSVAALGLYAMVGTPNFRDSPAVETAAGLEGQSLDQLVAMLEQRLATDPNAPAVGYVLLARSLMSLQRYEEAIAAYETAASRPDAVAEIGQELAEARAFIAGGGPNGMPMLDRGTVESVQALSEEDQAAMIEGMVAGLAARLEANPGDAEGWARLIRARMVLGQREQAAQDLASALAGSTGDEAAQAYLRDVADELSVSLPD